jgi:heptose-I-phosphate ethanolaminephosphotransferase
MTLEGYLIIIISILVCINFFQSKSTLSEGEINFTKPELLMSTILFCTIFTCTFFCTKIIIGLILLNSFVWLAFVHFIKHLKYTLLTWASAFVYCFYLYATYSNFNSISTVEIWKLTLFIWSATLFCIIIYDVVGNISRFLASFLASILALAIFTPPFIFVLYNKAFHLQINVSQLNAIYQSNLREAYEFSTMYASIYQLILIPFVIIGLITFIFIQGYIVKPRLNRSVYTKIVVLLLVVVNLNLPKDLALPSLIINTREVYASELDKFRKELSKRKIGEVSFEAEKSEAKELFVVIVGESLNKNHMSLYGYHRNTTPLLDSLNNEGSLVKYENVFSNHTHTIPVLTQALTTANQLNGEKYFSSVSILDIMEQAQFNTYWVSNQVSFGEWDNPISVLADRADHRININTNVGKVTTTNNFDEELVNELQKIVADGIEQNTVVFLHMMGNHGAYKNRYPSSCKTYSGPLAKGEFGANKYWAKNVNEYDNSVVYQDILINDVVSVINEYDGTSACLYFSDHSEDVFANKGHNASSFTFEMTQTPLFAWFSEGYKSKYATAYNNFNSNKESLFSNDFIYELLIDFVGISTSHYDSERSLMSSNYRLNDSDCFTLHGKLKYSDSKNTFYHQKKNLAIIDSLHLNSKIYPHRVNTVGKLCETMYSGSNSIEVDVIFKQKEGLSYFEIGHDNGAISGIRLEDFLIKIGNHPMKNLWLDIKNLDESNLLALEQRLVDLDKLYSIKNYSIVETTSNTGSFSRLADLGFHTSFYIPTSLKDSDAANFKAKAIQIADQVRRQKVSAVSFDASLYPFVKNFLEAYLDESIVYHTWDVKLKLKEESFWQEMSSKKYLTDNRVKSILVKYHSSFEL